MIGFRCFSHFTETRQNYPRIRLEFGDPREIHFLLLLKYIVFHPSQYSSENSNYLDENETVITINVSGSKGINMMRIAQNQ